MTEKEAIEILRNNFPKTCKMVNGRYKGGFDDTECEFGKALMLSISALEEIQQYRAIGTVEECREAMERRNPKAPVVWGDGYDNEGNMIYDMYDCPNCGKSYEVDYHDYKFCPCCGQAILWELQPDSP